MLRSLCSTLMRAAGATLAAALALIQVLLLLGLAGAVRRVVGMDKLAA